MRITAYVLSVAVGLAALVATTEGLPESGVTDARIVPFITAAIAMWAVGLFSGVVSAGSMRDPGTPDGRRASRIFLGVSGVVVLAAILLMVVPAVAGDVPIGVAAAGVAAAAVFIAANGVVGRYLRGRADRRRIGPFPIPPLDPDYSRRRAYSTVLITSAVLVGGVLLALTAGRPASESAPDAVRTVALAVSFAALTATALSTFPSVTLSGRVRDLSGTDAARLKRIRRVLLGGKAIALTDDETEIAARYAPYAAQSQRWSLAQTLTVFVAVLSINEPSADRPLQLAIWIFFPVVAAILTPFGLRAAHRADAYALDHQGISGAEAPDGTDAPAAATDTAAANPTDARS